MTGKELFQLYTRCALNTGATVDFAALSTNMQDRWDSMARAVTPAPQAGPFYVLGNDPEEAGRVVTMTGKRFASQDAAQAYADTVARGWAPFVVVPVKVGV
jgi:hypothetical protein